MHLISSPASKGQSLSLQPLMSTPCHPFELLVRSKTHPKEDFFSKKDLRGLPQVLVPFIFPFISLCLGRCPIIFVFIFIIVFIFFINFVLHCFICHMFYPACSCHFPPYQNLHLLQSISLILFYRRRFTTMQKNTLNVIFLSRN